MGQSEKLSKNNLHEISIIVGRGHGIGPIYAKRLYDEIRRLQAQLSQEIEARKKAESERDEIAAKALNEADMEGCCMLCGHPMTPGEEMFKFHGYSGDCPVTTKAASLRKGQGEKP